MSYKVMFVLHAVVSLAFGIAFVFVPTMMMDFFGTDTYAVVKTMTQFFGSALLTLGLLLWFVKDVTDEKIQKGMGSAMLVAMVVGLVVAIIAVALDGVIRNYGWLVILVYVLLGLGYAFMLFLKPKMKE